MSGIACTRFMAVFGEDDEAQRYSYDLEAVLFLPRDVLVTVAEGVVARTVESTVYPTGDPAVTIYITRSMPLTPAEAKRVTEEGWVHLAKL